MAPHIVLQALKTAVFAASVMEELNIPSFPRFDEKRSDIIQRIALGSPEKMKLSAAVFRQEHRLIPL